MINLSQTKMEGVTQNRQNQLKMHSFYVPTLSVILGDPVQSLKCFLLVERVQNSYSRKINECQSFFSAWGFSK